MYPNQSADIRFQQAHENCYAVIHQLQRINSLSSGKESDVADMRDKISSHTNPWNADEAKKEFNQARFQLGEFRTEQGNIRQMQQDLVKERTSIGDHVAAHNKLNDAHEQLKRDFDALAKSLEQRNTKLKDRDAKLEKRNAKLEETNTKLEGRNTKLQEKYPKLDEQIEILNLRYESRHRRTPCDTADFSCRTLYAAENIGRRGAEAAAEELRPKNKRIVPAPTVESAPPSPELNATSPARQVEIAPRSPELKPAAQAPRVENAPPSSELEAPASEPEEESPPPSPESSASVSAPEYQTAPEHQTAPHSPPSSATEAPALRSLPADFFPVLPAPIENPRVPAQPMAPPAQNRAWQQPMQTRTSTQATPAASPPGVARNAAPREPISAFNDMSLEEMQQYLAENPEELTNFSSRPAYSASTRSRGNPRSRGSQRGGMRRRGGGGI